MTRHGRKNLTIGASQRLKFPCRLGDLNEVHGLTPGYLHVYTELHGKNYFICSQRTCDDARKFAEDNKTVMPHVPFYFTGYLDIVIHGLHDDLVKALADERTRNDETNKL